MSGGIGKNGWLEEYGDLTLNSHVSVVMTVMTQN